MNADRWFDGLARTLAEPMPRRRAVRVIGVSLATLAVPALRPRLARAQVGCTAKTCHYDQRCCQKGAEANFETYCCPRPSWQFQCGGQNNGYKCVNTCKPGGRNFACTALIEHPESGINGVCCDRKWHSGCSQIGPHGGGKRPDGTIVESEEWKPSCCPKGGGFTFCGGICCQPPNRCRDGECTCPDGTASIDGQQCCRRGEHPRECWEENTKFTGDVMDTVLLGSVVGRKCCPNTKPYCCGQTCCKEFGCCGDKCCPHNTSHCARSAGRQVCCPKLRLAVMSDDEFLCCPPGTGHVPTTGGCCPPSALDCCGPIKGPGTDCGPGKWCVKGKCVVR